MSAWGSGHPAWFIPRRSQVQILPPQPTTKEARMRKYRISWGLDGSDDGEDIIEADSEDEARSEAYYRLYKMLVERAHYGAETLDT